jgi:hypothetical protein
MIPLRVNARLKLYSLFERESTYGNCPKIGGYLVKQAFFGKGSSVRGWKKARSWKRVREKESLKVEG